ncbi:UDP-N-acetylmuramate dehydrogenase [Solimicrobium silvestre]|uniref:UDP-N-acetylenolpyruvoylglucosamine reductase n=1 Tax=Solimicrobium silvestre TaxID=2099400 RepID=A0A2S9GWE3_9BURK|nr:UDP-N-acetylmuramate dehydrogenase [Solimicrobium silvestre]PRC92018.1 murB: UDP-N-acetylenolpyruvoylglucosamine reductase [Solimicrobium silvestre]
MSSSLHLQSAVSLQSFTTFGIAASARHYLRVNELSQLQQISLLPELAGLPRLILGGGSNLILTQDFPGVVVHMALEGRECVSEDAQFVYVRAAAGEVWHDFVQWTLAQGWGGLENLSLIPGSVGAAPIQNIGAYGVEIKDYFHSLSWLEFASGKIHTFTLAECQFAYRDSVFKHALRDQGVILDVTFALAKQWQAKLGYGDVAQALQGIKSPTPKQVSNAICAIRLSKLPDPSVIGNAGSFFKNPLVSVEFRNALIARCPGLVSYLQTDGQYKLAAGWLIEQAGWKGRALGKVAVYAKQALVLVNLGGATGAEVVALAQAIQADVMQKFGVQLEVEPVFV